MIPKYFHRIWLGPNARPPNSEAYGRALLEHHPGWQICDWGESDMGALVNRGIYDELTSWSAKSDVARIEILARLGGVYVDYDMRCQKSIEPLLEGMIDGVLKSVSAFAAWEQPRRESISNAIMGAEPGHPFFEDAVRSLPTWFSKHRHSSVPWQAGPRYLTTLIERHLDLTIFESRHFYPFNYEEMWRRSEPFPDACFVHDYALSWCK